VVGIGRELIGDDDEDLEDDDPHKRGESEE